MCTLSHIFKHQNWLEAELVEHVFALNHAY